MFSVKFGNFKLIVIPITLADMSFGLYLLILFIKDHVSNEIFVIKEIQWTSSHICFLTFAVILNFSMLSLLLISFLSFMRTAVVLYPLKRKFKQRNVVVKCILSTLLFAVMLSIIISAVQWVIFTRIAFKFCTPFVDPTGSNTLVTGITWFFCYSSTILFNIYIILKCETSQAFRNFKKRNYKTSILYHKVI